MDNGGSGRKPRASMRLWSQVSTYGQARQPAASFDSLIEGPPFRSGTGLRSAPRMAGARCRTGKVLGKRKSRCGRLKIAYRGAVTRL